MNWLNLIELPLQEFALAHYREALRLSGIKGRSEVGKLLREDFPNGGLSDQLKYLGNLPLNEIGLFFFYLGCRRVHEVKSDQYCFSSQIHKAYAERFHINAPANGMISRRRYYRLIEKTFGPLIRDMQTDKESTEWRTYLDMCVGKEMVA